MAYIIEKVVCFKLFTKFHDFLLKSYRKKKEFYKLKEIIKSVYAKNIASLSWKIFKATPEAILYSSEYRFSLKIKI